MSLHNNRISVDRESVCMGDDCNAPNEKVLDLSEEDKLTDVFRKVAEYLPQMSDVIWAVDSGRKVLGYIIMDKDRTIHYEICQPDGIFSDMKINALHCSYFFPNRFICNVDGEIKEKYPEQKTFLDKVRFCMQERFLGEIQINGGSLCIWGEWFGRPYDNFHRVKSVRWERDKIVIDFAQGESLYISNPKNIVNEEKQLLIGDASKVLFVWYYYGKEQTYENMYVRQYNKDSDGNILRSEGRRRDVGINDGTEFHAKGENAVCIVNY